jgi:large subunit ribosomal protein L13
MRLSMKTIFAKKDEIERKWYLIDAEGMVVGRLASRIALLLRGKNKPLYTPHVDSGDFVVVINADKVLLTGNKLKNKEYIHHTGYPGGIKKITAQELMKSAPEKIIINAVNGMLAKNKHRSLQLKRLKVYCGREHPHTAQNPEKININKE